ncbi:MAG: histone deacetylase [Candidatus Krumholzibacteria bacterium]|nr:histone deacetylase [Candidatus Krumholzibacteria bacterium]
MACGFHIDARYAAHENPPGHPERADRIRFLLPLAESLAESGIPMIATDRRAGDEDLLRVHSGDHVERMRATAGRSLSLDPDTFTSEASHETALLAAGAALEMVDRVMNGTFACAFAAVRPPGHHAESERAMGFCLFNNVAVAARHLLDAHGLERVLIVDWDVHHGNGTQWAFYDDDRVLFVSLHQYPFYPGTGSVEETGDGRGAGFTVNVPLPAGCDDADYMHAFGSVVDPIARRFAPQFVLVSAGFDAHRADPLGGMRVTETGFDAMAAAVMGIAGASAEGRVVCLLEGGYDLQALRDSVDTVVRRLHAGGAGAAVSGAPGASARRAVERVIEVQGTHWEL